MSERSDGEMRNARIRDTFLGIEDHNLFIISIEMDYGSSRQHYQRILGADAASLTRIRQLLEVVEVESWERLKGTYCRVIVDDGLIRAVGHVIEDKWTS